MGHATFTEDKCVEVDGIKYSADHYLIASGGRPIVPSTPGKQTQSVTHLETSYNDPPFHYELFKILHMQS